MSFVVIIDIPKPPEVVRRFEEEERPDILKAIQKVADGLHTAHRRFSGPNGVVDIDEFASEADYKRYLEEADPHLKAYATFLGVEMRETPLVQIPG